MDESNPNFIPVSDLLPWSESAPPSSSLHFHFYCHSLSSPEWMSEWESEKVSERATSLPFLHFLPSLPSPILDKKQKQLINPSLSKYPGLGPYISVCYFLEPPQSIQAIKISQPSGNSTVSMATMSPIHYVQQLISQHSTNQSTTYLISFDTQRWALQHIRISIGGPLDNFSQISKNHPSIREISLFITLLNK